MDYKWYILNVVSGQEQKIANDIKSMIGKSLGDYVNDVLVPCKQVVKIRKGQKSQENQKIFPGYVFVNANLNSDAYNIINSIPKSMGFLGRKNNPDPVSEEKMRDVISLAGSGVVESGKTSVFEIGEVLNVVDGPFESFSGVVEEFDHEKHRVRISILIFGRATSVELDVTQVEKLVR